MEVQDGFIVGIFNYCDRWCERCPLTSRCRVFVDVAELEFEHAHGPLTEPKVVRARRQFAAELGVSAAGEAFADRFPETDDGPVGHLPSDLESAIGPDPKVVARGPELRALMSRLKRSDDPMVRLAMETLEHFALFVPGKVIRALSPVAAEGPGDQQSDANGSGKAALLGLERMESAWRTLVDAHHVTPRDAAPFLAEIGRLQRNLQRALPNARAFIRPGFDEPDEMQRLEASDW